MFKILVFVFMTSGDMIYELEVNQPFINKEICESQLQKRAAAAAARFARSMNIPKNEIEKIEAACMSEDQIKELHESVPAKPINEPKHRSEEI